MGGGGRFEVKVYLPDFFLLFKKKYLHPLKREKKIEIKKRGEQANAPDAKKIAKIHNFFGGGARPGGGTCLSYTI